MLRQSINPICLLIALVLLGVARVILPAATPYDMGIPTLSEIYVSPTGSDSSDGLSTGTPLRTITAAMGRVPQGAALTGTGYRINLLPGVYTCEPGEPDNCQNFFADRTGTAQCPVILRALGGPETATVRGGFDFARMSYLYLLDLRMIAGGGLPINNSGNDLLHLASVDHVLLRNVVLQGPDCRDDVCNNLQEVLKVNQASHLYIENCDIGGTWHTAIDFFVVQHSHVINSRLHTAGQWCMYVKGGCAYLLVEGNELHHAQLGFGAGQSANLAMMRTPWVHYDVYDVKFINNIVHDIDGVGLALRGVYNGLFAYNTFANVGFSSDPGYPLLEAVAAERGCNPTDELPNPVPTCQALINQGAWGPNFLTPNLEAIPNKNAWVVNNVFHNPSPSQTLYTHFSVRGPFARPSGFYNLPASITTDENLVIAGNVIWNGPSDHPLGLDESTGCQSGNPTCNEEQLKADNSINTIMPQFVDSAHGDYRPAGGGSLTTVAAIPVPDFVWDSFTPSVPTGNLSNAVTRDRGGNTRSLPGIPGAYAVVEPPEGVGFVVR